jgi:predicted Zn-dependent protease
VLQIGTAASGVDPQTMGPILGRGAQYGVLMPFSRSHESIADSFGLDIMADAGFDPRESVALWRNMAAASQGAPLEFLSTHPSHGTRIDALSQRIPAAMERSRRAQEAGRRPHCQ